VAKKSVASKKSGDWATTLENLPILQLGLAGVPQRAIRAVVGCDMNRVNRILKHLKKKEASKT